MANKGALDLCLFYHEEPECPFDLQSTNSTFWSIEEGWIKLVVDDELRSDNLLVPFLLTFNGGLDAFDVDVTLKAYLWDQFVHFGGTKDGFLKFLLLYMAGPEL